MDTKIGETKTLQWSREDTPIPKKGEVLSNQFREQYKVVSVARGNPDHTIVFRRIA